MNDLFFLIGWDHVNSGEFASSEVGYWAVRGHYGVLVFTNRQLAELAWSSIAHHHGYTYN
jgi:hypothetical protein